jgi:hypothetical protein
LFEQIENDINTKIKNRTSGIGFKMFSKDGTPVFKISCDSYSVFVTRAISICVHQRKKIFVKNCIIAKDFIVSKKTLDTYSIEKA